MNNKLTIGIFNDSYYPMIDGVYMVVDNYARRLTKYANVIVFVPDYKKTSYDDSIFPYKIVRCKSLKFLFQDYVIPIPKVDSKFKQELEKYKLDIVHIHSPFALGRIGLNYAKRHNIPCVATMHSQFKQDFKKAFKSEYIATKLTNKFIKTYNECDTCWAVNNEVARIFHDEYHYKGLPKVMNNATEMELVSDIEKAHTFINEKHKIGENETVFLFVGRINTLKNIFFIVESLKLLKIKKPDLKWKMLFVGSGQDEDKLKKKISELGLTKEVIMCGKITNRQELAYYYSRADLMLFPSKYDSSSIVQIEAASQKTPTVFLENTATAETVTNNVNGYLSKDSVDDYSNKIIEILENKELYNEVKENAYRDLYKSWDSMVDDAYYLYKDLIEQKSKNKKITGDYMELKKWHSTDTKDVLEILKSNEEGLTNEEALARLKKYGKNELPKKEKDSILTIFFRELKDPIVLLLLFASIVSFLINEKIDGIAILFIIFVDLILGTYQEWKANKNVEALAKLIEEKVKILRFGQTREIDACDLVIGDIVLLESGDKISADMRLIESNNLSIDESILTGESTSVEKDKTTITKDVILAERKNMLYAGTSVLTGRAKAIVTATGTNTEIGEIASRVNNTEETKSPLTIRMEKFSKQITYLVIVIAVIIAIALYSKGTTGSEIFLSVIALSVSAMPEGLPLALTMALTIGSNRMSKENVVVKRLNSVESLGSCTVIASDKTGTLTVNEQTAKRIVLPDNSIFDIEGTGYNDLGKIISRENSNLKDAKYISKLGVLNNEAILEKIDDSYRKVGDSIDIAFLALGLKASVDIKNIEITDRINYESEKKYSAVFFKENDKNYCTIKGSLEKVLEFCTTMTVKDKKVKIDKELLKKQNEDLASSGYRVIAIADGTSKDKNNLKDLNFVGLVAFIDPIREEAKESIKECKTAGIKVIMVTGDHPLTAYSIAKDLGLVEDYSEVTTGQEVNEYLEKGKKAFDKFIKTKKVFTRVTPLNKLEIVESLKRQGEFVAVTGDGVNDAPAIKSANIGIAMGSGTDVAKETSSMIILDDNFKSIVVGIKEGRNAYSNIRKISYMLLSCGVAEVLFFLLAIILDMPMPLVAIQLLWLNIVTDGLQDFALSFEKAESNIMKEPPRDPKETLFNKNLASEVLISGLAIGIIVFLTWMYLLNKLHMPIDTARGYIMTLMVFMQNMHVLNCRSEKQSTFKVSLKTNPLIIFSILGAIFLQIIFSEIPYLSKFLQTTSIPIIHMLILFALSTIIIFIMEIYKAIKRKI